MVSVKVTIPGLEVSMLLLSHRKTTCSPRKWLAAFGILAVALLPVTASAQISVNGEDGEKVIIGPNGIDILSTGGGRSSVLLGPGGLNINSRRAPAVQSAPVNAGLNLQAALAKLETVSYGKTNESAPLIVRIKQLEVDNLGKEGSGSNVARIQAVAQAMGVNLFDGSTVTTTTVTTATPVMTPDQPLGEHFVINENYFAGTHLCKSSTVTVNSNHCDVQLTGVCSLLNVLGNHNTVTVSRAVNVRLVGNHNTVHWIDGPAPSIAYIGSHNTVAKREP